MHFLKTCHSKMFVMCCIKFRGCLHCTDQFKRITQGLLDFPSFNRIQPPSHNQHPVQWDFVLNLSHQSPSFFASLPILSLRVVSQTGLVRDRTWNRFSETWREPNHVWTFVDNYILTEYPHYILLVVEMFVYT